MIETFYNDILCGDGQRVVATINHKTKKIQHYVVPTDKLISTLSQAKTSTYHSLGTYEGLKLGKLHEVDDLKAVRVKAWAFDLDVGSSTKKYASLEDAVSALTQAVEAGAIPEPTWVVSSGGGLQIYYVLGGTGIDEDLWFSHFLRARQRLKAHLKFDATVGTRPYRLLRSLCTDNYKYEPPRPVEIMHRGPYTDESWFTSLAEVTVSDNKDTDKVTDDPLAIADIVKSCKALRQMYIAKGAGVDYQAWCATANICAHGYGGRKWFHKFSEGHKDYDEAECTAKYNEIKSKASNGPWSCDFFGDFENPISDCHGCPWRKRGAQNPVHATRMRMLGSIPKAPPKPKIEPAPLVPVDETATAVAELEDEIEETLSFEERLDKMTDLGIMHPLTLEGREWTHKNGLVCDFFYFREFRRDLVEGTGTVGLSPDGETWTYVAPSDISRPSQLAAEAMAVGIRVIDDAWFSKLVRFYCFKDKPETEVGCYGWSPDFKSFLSPSGHRGPKIHASRALEPIQRKWGGTAGSVENWLEAVQIYGRSGQEPYLVAMLVSLASPLMSYYDLQKGVIYSIKGAGGVGKSTAMEVATSVWGKPIHTVAGLSSTFNSVRAYMKRCSRLPMVVDDLTLWDSEQFKQLALEISQGTGRERLTKDLNLSPVETWWLNFMTTTNTSMHAKLAEHINTGVAEMNRLVEVSVPESRNVTEQEGRLMINQVKANYGHAGNAMIEHLLKRKRSDELTWMQAFSAKMSDKDKLKGSDRFSRDLIAACYRAHVLIKEVYPQFPGNPKEILTWMRGMLRDNNRYIAEILQVRVPKADDFLTDFAAEGLIIARQSNGTYPAQSASFKGLIFDLGYESDFYAIPKETFEQWCRRVKAPRNMVLSYWASEGRLTNFSNDEDKPVYMGKLDYPLTFGSQQVTPTVLQVRKTSGLQATGTTSGQARLSAIVSTLSDKARKRELQDSEASVEDHA